MSLFNSKTYLTTLLVILAFTTTAFGQQRLNDARLFAPREYDQFGGPGQRLKDGFYGSVEYTSRFISAPEVHDVGSEDIAGRDVVLTNGTTSTQQNTLDSSFINADPTPGTLFEFGYMNKHHGWIFSGYKLHQNYSHIQGTGMDMMVNDLGSIDVVSGGGDEWVDTTGPGTIPSGFLDGWVPLDPENTSDAILGPLPLSFDNYLIENEVDTWSMEWMYIYRAHPLQSGGAVDFFGGVRYMEFNDKFTAQGWGTPWQGITSEFTPDEDDDDGGEDDTTAFEAEYPYGQPLPIEQAPGDGTFTLDGDPTGTGSILADSWWRLRSDNHIVGPQVGARYFRKYNRWTLSAEGRFFAGFNFQNVRSLGTLGTKHNSSYVDLTGVTFPDGGMTDPTQAYTPIGFLDGDKSFNHVEYFQEWSPGVEFRLDANWQLTDAIGFRAGYGLLWMDNIARANGMTDYTLHQNGSIFGVNGAHNTQSLYVHGWNLGVTINRY